MGNVVLISGGTGIIGSALSAKLASDGYTVRLLSRNPKRVNFYQAFYWDADKGEIDEKAFAGITDIIHLAGAGVADSRWTPKRKREIVSSRVESSKLLFRAVEHTGTKLDAFISASGTGIYGSTGSEEVNEKSTEGSDFLAEVVRQWEASVEPFSSCTRLVKFRIGVVLSMRGGALLKMSTPIRYWFGAPLGSGDQLMSWIHEDDLVSIFQFALEHPIHGVFNATAPNPVTNKEFTKALASRLGKPLLLPNVPPIMLRLLLGEMASMVLSGSKASSRKMVEQGFRFQYERLDKALEDLLIR